jgi:hypothetical protein
LDQAVAFSAADSAVQAVRKQRSAPKRESGLLHNNALKPKPGHEIKQSRKYKRSVKPLTSS